MKSKLIYLVVFCFIATTGCSNNNDLSNSIIGTTTNNEYETTMKRDILCLMVAYPNYITGVEKDSKDNVYIIMKSGKKILYDDKSKKSFSQKLENPDIQDMMEQEYPLGKIDKVMEKNYDPGRIRVYSILKEVYGNNRSTTEKNLTNVYIGSRNFPFNKENQCAENLKLVLRELNEISRNNWKIQSNIYPSSGTYNFRVISGTNRLSPHAFGIAVDLKRDKRDYWKWATIEQGNDRIKEYPVEIVQIFEKYNFVWGGKWNHFDILHFEYRPEILLKAKYFGSKDNNNVPWYEGAPNNDSIKEYIRIIEESI